ncbi:MarR family winged helix-turn-helix transcriptional regulator [Rhodopseudomonas palustris]
MRVADLLGKQIGVSGSQWVTLKAIESLDRGEGISIKDVAALLNVDRSFLSAQSKVLEMRGLIRRNSAAATDRRLVLLSLTESAMESMKAVQPSKTALEEHLRGDLDGLSLLELENGLSAIRRRLGRAMLLVAAGE